MDFIVYLIVNLMRFVIILIKLLCMSPAKCCTFNGTHTWHNVAIYISDYVILWQSRYILRVWKRHIYSTLTGKTTVSVIQSRNNSINVSRQACMLLHKHIRASIPEVLL